VNDGWITLGYAVVIGLPLAVVFAAVFWPERIPKERTVQAIRRRIGDEDTRFESGSDR